VTSISVCLETGARRAIASALDWPGWCRVARDEALALQALLDYAPRYARVMTAAGIDFPRPAGLSSLVVVERLAGNAATDFGVPNLVAETERSPLDRAGLDHLCRLLQASWDELDRLAAAAAGKELRRGPRGGGRNLEQILRHVLDTDKSYLGSLGWKLEPVSDLGLKADFAQARLAILEGLDASVAGQIPERGPRGGLRWTARYFFRRSAWHCLDHAWEIEDRTL